MITYNDIYEILRKEKYSEQLQPLSKKFISDFAQYIAEKTKSQEQTEDLFSDTTTQSKKQLENAISLFKELILRRKRKILNLVFVATETGIMKRDYENMIPVEKETFDKLMKGFEECDKEISKMLKGKEVETITNKMIIFNENVEEFMNHDGKPIGPHETGELVNIETEIAQILVDSGKASFVDED